jgi:hypothetical protein
MNKLQCYCELYSQEGMCAAHTAKKWRDEILQEKSLRRKLFGLSQSEKQQIKSLEGIMYREEVSHE